MRKELIAAAKLFCACNDSTVQQIPIKFEFKNVAVSRCIFVVPLSYLLSLPKDVDAYTVGNTNLRALPRTDVISSVMNLPSAI